MTTPVDIRLGSPAAKLRTESFLDGRLRVHSPRGVNPPERVLLGALSGLRFAGRVLVVGSREALLPTALHGLDPTLELHTFHLDAHESERAREGLRRNDTRGARVHLGADLPLALEPDIVVLLASHGGDSLLTLDLLQQSVAALRPQGKLVAAIDSPKDRRLHERIVKLLGSATIHARTRRGVVYVARKPPGLRVRARPLARRFEVTACGVTLALSSRPGIFSHGELDEGALALVEVARDALATAPRTVLDLGCGAGAVGLLAAGLHPAGRVVLLDANARAVAAARANAIANGLAPRTLAVLARDLAALRPGAIDRVLTNPPYFSHYRISELFCAESRRVLARDGELYLVTKSPDPHREIVARHFSRHEVIARRGYSVLHAWGATRRGG